MFIDECLISNNEESLLIVWGEPWGDLVRIPAGKTAKFVSNSKFPGQYSQENSDGEVILYAWSGCDLDVTIDGQKVLHYDIRAPGNTGMLNKILRDLRD